MYRGLVTGHHEPMTMSWGQSIPQFSKWIIQVTVECVSKSSSLKALSFRQYLTRSHKLISVFLGNFALASANLVQWDELKVFLRGSVQVKVPPGTYRTSSSTTRGAGLKQHLMQVPHSDCTLYWRLCTCSHRPAEVECGFWP